jgi:hypothetical protein
MRGNIHLTPLLQRTIGLDRFYGLQQNWKGFVSPGRATFVSSCTEVGYFARFIVPESNEWPREMHTLQIKITCVELAS